MVRVSECPFQVRQKPAIDPAISVAFPDFHKISGNRKSTSSDAKVTCEEFLPQLEPQ
jgi:hypothetical protein